MRCVVDDSAFCGDLAYEIVVINAAMADQIEEEVVKKTSGPSLTVRKKQVAEMICCDVEPHGNFFHIDPRIEKELSHL